MKQWLNLMESALGEKKKSPAGGPPCWKGKKIHPTKPTKMKGGKRVNNCIDAGTNESMESVDEAKVNDYAREIGIADIARDMAYDDVDVSDTQWIAQRLKKQGMNPKLVKTPEFMELLQAAIADDEAGFDDLGAEVSKFKDQGMEENVAPNFEKPKAQKSRKDLEDLKWIINDFFFLGHNPPEDGDPKARMLAQAYEKETGDWFDPNNFDKQVLWIARKLEVSPKFVKKSLKDIDIMHIEGMEEGTDFRKGDSVKHARTGEKGTVLHKGNRDQVVVKFGSLNKSLPASELRLVDELDEADVCPQCGSADCTCKPGECDCEPVKETDMNSIAELRKLAGLSESDDCDETCPKSCPDCGGTGVAKKKVDESYPMAPYGEEQDTTDVNYSQTKRMGDASVTVSAHAKSMDELHKVLAMAGLDPSMADKYAEPEPEVTVVDEPDSDCGCSDSDDLSYSTDKQALVDMLRQKMQQRLG